MATSQPPTFEQLASGGPRSDIALRNVTATYRVSTTAENRAHEAPRAEKSAVASLSPSTTYKIYLDQNIQRIGDQDYFEPYMGGQTCRPEGTAAQSVPINDAQPQAGDHAVAYRLAARLANCSNGAPLPTIIEQGSYSTLNSHGSLLSVGRFPSTKAAEAVSPTCGSRRRSRSLDEKTLQLIEEDLAQEMDTCAVAVPHMARLNAEHEAADPASGTATPLTSFRFEMHHSPLGQSGEEILDRHERKVKGFVRGVLQNIRGVSRARSRSSSSTHTPVVESRASPPSGYYRSPTLDQRGSGERFPHVSRCGRSFSDHSSEDAGTPSATEDQTRSRPMPGPCNEPSAWTHPLRVQSHSDATNLRCDASGFLPTEHSFQKAAYSHEWPSSLPVVHAGTRDVAQGDGAPRVSLAHLDMFDTSARYTFDNIPVYREHLSSDRETASATEVFTNQNLSFCSTMSTSCSGTVLGVDTDLQQDFDHPVRRSQSPPEPVWFTPQMAELQKQASWLESPESVNANASNKTHCHSITSSALTSLLPIAAAAGVVQPNYNTPTISFFSPSGNLIAPESSSPQRTRVSDYSGPPIVTTSYYNRQNTTAKAPTGRRTARPPLISTTTPPTRTIPRPLHPRHRHNYHHPEASHISSRDSCVTPKGPVKGCDGVMRENSLTPRSGVFYPHGKDKAHRSAKLIAHDLKAEAKFYKARFLAAAAAQSFVPSIPKRRTLQKRRLYNDNIYLRSEKPHIENTSTQEGRSKVDALGPIAAHTLRVCFCQPYDGAGSSTRATTARACLASETFPVNGKYKADHDVKDVERLLPNARVAGSREYDECGDTKRKTRRDSAFSSTSQRISHLGIAKLKVG